MLYTRKTRNGLWTRPHGWKLDELESMKNSLSLWGPRLSAKLPVTQTIVPNHHKGQAGMPH